jgi:hypothetical protein
MQGTKRTWGVGVVFGIAVTGAALLATVGQTAVSTLAKCQADNSQPDARGHKVVVRTR